MKIQAKHIPDWIVLKGIKGLQEIPVLYVDRAYWTNPQGEILRVSTPRYQTEVSVWRIFRLWDTVPEKVLRAKLRALIKKGLIDGCVCGCRGDFTLTEKGSQELHVL